MSTLNRPLINLMLTVAAISISVSLSLSLYIYIYMCPLNNPYIIPVSMSFSIVFPFGGNKGSLNKPNIDSGSYTPQHK